MDAQVRKSKCLVLISGVLFFPCRVYCVNEDWAV